MAAMTGLGAAMHAVPPDRSANRFLRADFVDEAGRTLPAGIVATGAECAAFRLWVDALDPAGHDALVQLRESGFTYDLGKLEAQLRQALREVPAGPLARLVGGRVLALLAGRPAAACLVLGEAA